MCQKNLGKNLLFWRNVGTFQLALKQESQERIFPAPQFATKTKRCTEQFNASSCLDLSAFSIGGRSRRNVLRTGGCRGPVSPPAQFLSQFHCMCSLRLVVVCCSFFKPQLPSAIVRFLERFLPQAVVRYAFLDSNFFFFWFFPRVFWCQNCPDRIGILNTASWARRN